VRERADVLSAARALEEETGMSTNAGPYDTSRMYRSGSHSLHDEEAARPSPAPVAPAEEIVVAAANLRPAAAAVVAYSEYLLASPDLSRDQRAVVDALRRQAHRMMWALSGLPARSEPSS
jgi:hypothetical protein